MIYIASQGDTWDSIAYKAYKDEFMFPQILGANRSLSDVVIFDGGEHVTIPDRIVVENGIISSPFQEGASVRIITSPW